jgi:hypothetical protein
MNLKNLKNKYKYIINNKNYSNILLNYLIYIKTQLPHSTIIYTMIQYPQLRSIVMLMNMRSVAIDLNCVY